MKKDIYKQIIIITFILILYLFISTPTIVSIANRQVNIKKLDNATLFLDDTNSRYFLDNLEVGDDELCTVSIMGWAFCYTSNNSDAKKIDIILNSDANTYQISSTIMPRPDVTEYFHGELNVPVINQGFVVNFSPLFLKNGVYKLIISCQESELASALIDTDIYFEKNSKGFYKIINEK